MKFDIARQPLVPAFLTLAALAIAAMCGAGAHAPGTAAVGDRSASYAAGNSGAQDGEDRKGIDIPEAIPEFAGDPARTSRIAESLQSPAGNAVQTPETPPTPNAAAGTVQETRISGTPQPSAGDPARTSRIAESLQSPAGNAVQTPETPPTPNAAAGAVQGTRILGTPQLSADDPARTSRNAESLQSPAGNAVQTPETPPTPNAAAGTVQETRISGTPRSSAGDPARTSRIAETSQSSADDPARQSGTSSRETVAAASELAVRSPGELLVHFQTARPGWSRLIAAILILFTGMCAGRVTVRYNLYTVSTCLAIPLYGIVACGSAVGNNFLPAFAASALLALAVKNFSRSFRNGYGFDTIFRASLYLGLLPLVSASALPLLLLLPLALLLFRRTSREATVALAGLLLPALTLCYVNWGAGGSLLAPMTALGERFLSGIPLGMFFSLPLPQLLLSGGIVLLDLLALLFFLSDIYAAGTKPRFILIFSSCTLAMTLLLLAGPAASRGDIALVAVPSALLLPVLFVRTSRAITLPLYLLLLTAAFIGAVLQ